MVQPGGHKEAVEIDGLALSDNEHVADVLSLQEKVGLFK